MPAKPPRTTLSRWAILFALLSGCSLPLPLQESPPVPDQELSQPQLYVPEISPTGSLEDPSRTLAPACAEAEGLVEAFQVDRAGVELQGRIYTPPCYGADPGEVYPTLYLLHGATETDQQWLDLGIARTADSLIRRSVIPPLIIIMPREMTWIALPDNPFGDALVTELLPWVESHYRTRGQRDFRALGGLSRGGNWAVRIGLLHWGMFGAIGAHSTPLFYGDLDRLQGWVEAIPSSRYPRIYLDIGQDDNNLEAARNFEAALADLEVPHQWTINPGLHDDSYWSSHLEDYLLWYSQGWDHDHKRQ